MYSTRSAVPCEIFPDDAGVFETLGDTLRFQDRFDEAAEVDDVGEAEVRGGEDLGDVQEQPDPELAVVQAGIRSILYGIGNFHHRYVPFLSQAWFCGVKSRS